jgi:hypothetical protein
MNKQTPSSPARRSFLTSRTAGVTSIAALAVGGAALVQGKPKAAARWEPAHHDQDSWMDVPSKHRLVFDTTTAHGFGEGVLYAGNYLLANRDAYKMEDKDLAILIIARHASTPFAYNDAMWEKYGTAMRPLTQFDDPKTKAPPKKNVFNSADYGTQLPNFGTTIEAGSAVRSLCNGDACNRKLDCESVEWQRRCDQHRVDVESGEQRPHGPSRNRGRQSRPGVGLYAGQRLSFDAVRPSGAD